MIKDPFLKKYLENEEVKKIIEEHNLSEEIIKANLSQIFAYVDYDNPGYNKHLSYKNGLIYFDLEEKNPKFSSSNYKFESSVLYTDIEELVNYKAREEVYAYIRLILKGEAKGIYLVGRPGVGKTTILKHLASKMFEKGKDVLFLKFPNLIIELKNGFGDGSYKSLVNYLKRVEVLVLDDFSNDGFTKDWLRNEVLFTVLDYRLEHKLLTMFTSNFPLKELVNQGENQVDRIRIIERIRMLAKEIYLDDTSKRNY